MKTDTEVRIDQMTFLEARDRKLIDRDALRAALKSKDLNKLPGDPAARLKYRPDAVKGKWAHYWANAIDDASLLCSITAALRGRLHADRKWVAKTDSTGGRDKVTRTLEDQLALIGDSWRLFLKKDAAAQLEAEEAALAPPHLS